jgi:hypothetical protein
MSSLRKASLWILSDGVFGGWGMDADSAGREALGEQKRAGLEEKIKQRRFRDATPALT